MRKTKILAAFFMAAVILLAMPTLIALADITLPGSSELQNQIQDFSSNAWQSNANRDTGFTTLKKSGTTENRITSIKAFSGAYKLRFTVLFNDTSSWDSQNVKSVFSISLSGDAIGGFSDFFIMYEQSIVTGGDFYLQPANGYPNMLWQQPGLSGGFTESQGQSYDFMFDVKGDGTTDLYIEKFGVPLATSRYTAIANRTDVFDGHIVFESGTSGFDYEIGSLSVEYLEEGVQKIFKSCFNKDGALSTAQNKTDSTTFIANYTNGNSTRKESSQKLEQNQYLYGNFVVKGSSFSAEYELTDIVNGNAWNNMSSAIEFVGGITDENPDGVLLGRVYKNYISLGNHSWIDLSIADGVNPGKFITDTKYKFKIQFDQGSYQVYISAFLNGSYGSYVPFSSAWEDFEGEIGRIGIRVCSPNNSQPVSFKVKLLSVNGKISDEIFIGTPDTKFLNPSYSGTFSIMMPDMPIFNPAKTDERAIWALTKSDIATLSENILTVTNVGTLTLTLSAQSDPTIFKTFMVNIADGTPPEIKLEQNFINMKSGTLMESVFWENISVTDNVSKNIVPVLEGINFYASLDDVISNENGIAKTFEDGDLQMTTGVYLFTVSAADEAGNLMVTKVTYFIDAVMLSDIDRYNSLEFTGDVIKLNLPIVEGLGGAFIFEVVYGNAFLGQGFNEGKLLIFGEGNVKLLAINTLMPDLNAEFAFSVTDKQLPQITPYLSSTVKIGTLEAKIEFDNVFEFSEKTVAADYTVAYFKSKTDMEKNINFLEVTLKDNSFTAIDAGWYRINVTADDGKGNQAIKSYYFEALSSQAHSTDKGNNELFYLLSILPGALIVITASVLILTLLKKRDKA